MFFQILKHKSSAWKRAFAVPDFVTVFANPVTVFANPLLILQLTGQNGNCESQETTQPFDAEWHSGPDNVAWDSDAKFICFQVLIDDYLLWNLTRNITTTNKRPATDDHNTLESVSWFSIVILRNLTRNITQLTGYSAFNFEALNPKMSEFWNPKP